MADPCEITQEPHAIGPIRSCIILLHTTGVVNRRDEHLSPIFRTPYQRLQCLTLLHWRRETIVDCRITRLPRKLVLEACWNVRLGYQYLHMYDLLAAISRGVACRNDNGSIGRIRR